jgi:hypothetical protein
MTCDCFSLRPCNRLAKFRTRTRTLDVLTPELTPELGDQTFHARPVCSSELNGTVTEIWRKKRRNDTLDGVVMSRLGPEN